MWICHRDSTWPSTGRVLLRCNMAPTTRSDSLFYISWVWWRTECPNSTYMDKHQRRNLPWSQLVSESSAIRDLFGSQCTVHANNSSSRTDSCGSKNQRLMLFCAACGCWWREPSSDFGPWWQGWGCVPCQAREHRSLLRGLLYLPESVTSSMNLKEVSKTFIYPAITIAGKRDGNHQKGGDKWHCYLTSYSDPSARGAYPVQTKLQAPKIEIWNTINQWSFCQIFRIRSPPAQP